MPPAKVRPMSIVGPKWATRASTAAPEYEVGVRNPRAPWAASATAAKPAYDAGVQSAITRGAYVKGIAAAGDQRWSEKTIAKGPARFAQGVTVSQADYEKGFAPFRDAIERIDLPPRGPTGSPQNLQRMTGIPTALAALKRK